MEYDSSTNQNVRFTCSENETFVSKSPLLSKKLSNSKMFKKTRYRSDDYIKET